MVALKEVTVSTDADRRAVRTEMRALKTQRSPLLNSGFTTELAACPRIVDYYGSVVLPNGNACIAVEYVAGGSLESWVEMSGGGGGGGAEGGGATWGVCPEPWFAHIAYQALEVRRHQIQKLFVAPRVRFVSTCITAFIGTAVVAPFMMLVKSVFFCLRQWPDVVFSLVF